MVSDAVVCIAGPYCCCPHSASMQCPCCADQARRSQQGPGKLMLGVHLLTRMHASCPIARIVCPAIVSKEELSHVHKSAPLSEVTPVEHLFRAIPAHACTMINCNKPEASLLDNCR